MKDIERLALVVVGFVVVLIIAAACAGCTPGNRNDYRPGDTTEVNQDQTVVVNVDCGASCSDDEEPEPTSEPTSTPEPTEAPEPTEKAWVGDDFGPEQTLPDTITGPAIAEIWDGADYCALVRVNTGETLVWNNPGAWWQGGSQEALEARWPHHRAEYTAKSDDCAVILDVEEVNQ